MNKQLFVTGIGTGVGKTIVSALFTETLKADYWKPIQSGDLDQSDSMQIERLVNDKTIIHSERHRLKRAASPHKSSREENIVIGLNDFLLPETTNHLIVEGAGGIYVPINEKECMIDLISKLNLPTVVVANDYLGCINHTLLTIEVLKSKNIAIEYFVFNGSFDKDTERVIANLLPSSIKQIHAPELKLLTKEALQEVITAFSKQL